MACLFLSFIAADVQAKQLIWTISNRQMNSDKLEISGVSVSCFIGRGRSRGTFVTKVHKGGPGYNSGIRAGDVLLRINDKIITNARYADSAIQTLNGRVARVQLARKYDTNLQVKEFSANWNTLASATPSPSQEAGKPKVINRPKDWKPQKVSIDELETYLFNLVNADRKREGGLPPYQRSSGLSQLARTYANDQSRRGFTGHRDPEGRMPQDRANMAGINVPVCENVAWCEGDALTAAGKVKYCQDSMMSEPPNQLNHRGAILSTQYNYLGVGVAINDKGKVNIVQEFSTAPVP